jgi:translation initiation factor 2 beta subunit (eIF-2beta)/eIF-5
MLFDRNKHENKLQVDLGDVQQEKEHLLNFLQTHLKAPITENGKGVVVDSNEISLQELQHVVNKFVYHRNLNSTHWVSAEDKTVKINRFKTEKRKEKSKKEAPHQTLVQSWGL